MKREDLDSDINEKLLFEGSSGTGKTWLSMNIAKIYSIAGKKVLYIDPEKGTNKAKKKIFNNLTDEELDKITVISATNIEIYMKYMLGWRETKQVGSQTVEFNHGNDFDVKICDGLTTNIELFKTKLTQKFVKQGFYTVSEKNFPINNPELFTLPFQFYAKMYDSLKDSLNIMLDYPFDIIASMHPLKETEGQKELRESIFQKFDSILRLNKIVLSTGNPKWTATILKNRGRESPSMSNQLDDTSSLYMYFIKKFDLDSEETLKRLTYE